VSFYLTGGSADTPAELTPLAAHLQSARPRRYPSDMTDAEWEVIAPLVPAGRPGPRGGRPPVHSRRDIIDAIRYVTHNGGVWRALPADFPPWKTVYHYHALWTKDGTLNRLHDRLRAQVRQAEGRQPEPSAAIIDSQSVRAAEMVAPTSRGYDAGKKVNGRKRHIVVDTIGLLLIVLVTGAEVQDRDGARLALWALPACFTSISLIWADAGYAGKLVTWAPGHLGTARTRADRTDSAQARRAGRVPGPSPPVGPRAHPGVDHSVSPHCPRLRAATCPPRRIHPMGHDHRHGPATGTPPLTRTHLNQLPDRLSESLDASKGEVPASPRQQPRRSVAACRPQGSIQPSETAPRGRSRRGHP
jgi:putative transposase